ncbi:hypothetical protein ACPC39_31840 [Streptomyces cellulosae]
MAGDAFEGVVQLERHTAGCPASLGDALSKRRLESAWLRQLLSARPRAEPVLGSDLGLVQVLVDQEDQVGDEDFDGRGVRPSTRAEQVTQRGEPGVGGCGEPLG